MRHEGKLLHSKSDFGSHSPFRRYCREFATGWRRLAEGVLSFNMSIRVSYKCYLQTFTVHLDPTVYGLLRILDTIKIEQKCNSPSEFSDSGFLKMICRHPASIFHCLRVISDSYCCSNRPEVEIASRWRRLAEVVSPSSWPISIAYQSSLDKHLHFPSLTHSSHYAPEVEITVRCCCLAKVIKPFSWATSPLTVYKLEPIFWGDEVRPKVAIAIRWCRL